MISKVYLIDDDEVCLLSSKLIFFRKVILQMAVPFLKIGREAFADLMHDLGTGNLPEIIS